MKRFKYSLDTVLDYKTQVLDHLKTEHAIILGDVNLKKGEIEALKTVQSDFAEDFDQVKYAGGSIGQCRLYDMCMERMEQKIDEEKEKLAILKQKEAEKKNEVVVAKVDTSKFEKLKGRRLSEYQKAEMKEEEAFAEEFVIHSLMAADSRVSLRR